MNAQDSLKWKFWKHHIHGVTFLFKSCPWFPMYSRPSGSALQACPPRLLLSCMNLPFYSDCHQKTASISPRFSLGDRPPWGPDSISHLFVWGIFSHQPLHLDLCLLWSRVLIITGPEAKVVHCSHGGWYSTLGLRYNFFRVFTLFLQVGWELLGGAGTVSNSSLYPLADSSVQSMCTE